MYKSVIEISRDVSEEMLEKLSRIADEAFHNRAGSVQNRSKTPYRLSYEGGEKEYGCLELGMLALEERKDFLACVEAWNWIDEEEPGENCDVLAIIRDDGKEDNKTDHLQDRSAGGEAIYKSVIEIRRDVSEEMLEKLSRIADEAFHNRAGSVQNKSKTPYRLSYEGGEKEYGCLELGMLALEERKDFLACVEAWTWIDEEEPGENCDVLAEMAIPVR